MVNYTVIIPHKNIPDLLQRCLDSIPPREDVQVIVVDDDSDAGVVDFDCFPGKERSDVEMFFTKEGRGSGYARNVGMQHAKGKWVMFADADDFFTEEYERLLNEMVNADEDLVYFDYCNVLSDDISQEVKKRTWIRPYLAAYMASDGKNKNDLITQYIVPWGKLIKRELIERNDIWFDETRWGTDVFFSTQVAIKARSIGVNERIVYVLTERPGSLVYDLVGTLGELRVRSKVGMKSDALFAANGYCVNRADRMLNIAYNKHGFCWLVWFGMTNIYDWPVFRRTMSFLAPIFKRKVKLVLKSKW